MLQQKKWYFWNANNTRNIDLFGSPYTFYFSCSDANSLHKKWMDFIFISDDTVWIYGNARHSKLVHDEISLMNVLNMSCYFLLLFIYFDVSLWLFFSIAWLQIRDEFVGVSSVCVLWAWCGAECIKSRKKTKYKNTFADDVANGKIIIG